MQLVREADIAHHAGVWLWNQHSIGIEVERLANATELIENAQYSSVNSLVSSIRTRFNVPLVFPSSGPLVSPTVIVDGIVGHGKVVANGVDPVNWDWAYFKALFDLPIDTQTITFVQPPAKTYGDDPFNLEASATSGLPIIFSVVSGPASLVSENTLSCTGAGTVTVEASQPGGDGWMPATPVSRNIFVAKAVLTAKADDKTKVQGTSNPPLTVSYTGFVNGEDVSVIDSVPAASTTAEISSPANDYPIMLAGGADNNYSFNLQNGTLTVTAVGIRQQLSGMIMGDGLFLFALNGPAGSKWVIQYSSDLVSWTSIATYTVPASGSIPINDPITPGKSRCFYRAVPSSSSSEPVVLQPGPADGKDIWTTSIYSNSECSKPGPGGGLNNDELRVGGWADSYYSLLQFDLSGVPATASSAIMYLYCYSNNSGTGTPLLLDRITQDWDWRTSGTGCDRERLWWADKPETSQWRIDQLPTPDLNQWYTVDITDLYNAWKNGTYPNYGLQLRPVSNWNNYDLFYSSDYLGDPSLRPKLVVKP